MSRTALQSSCVMLALGALAQPARAQESTPAPVPPRTSVETPLTAQELPSPPRTVSSPLQSGDAPPPQGTESPPKAAVETPLTESELTPSANERTVYTAADFARFAPRNALQMLQNVPGFAVEKESEERGLGQASGNVLINGQRISSKSETASQQLSRVPASNVIRIELVDGSTLNIPGLSGQVANVVVRSGGGLRGRFEWRPQASTGVSAPRLTQGDVSISGKAGRLDYSVSLRNDSFYGGSAGSNLIVNGAGVPDPRFNTSHSTSEQPKLSTALKYDFGGGTRANLNLSGGLTRFRSDELENRTVVTAPTYLKHLNTSNDAYNYEISGDIEFTAGPGRLKLIALESFDHSDFLTQSRISLVPLTDSGSEFLRGSNEGERIGRGEYRWRLLGADWQFSLEAAFNRLDNAASLFSLNTVGAFVEIPFPSGTGGVRENRYEGILSFGRPLSSNLSLQLAAGAEYSKIAQTGSNALSRVFKRPKGSVTLAWAPEEHLNISLRAARKVGQLNFADFLAAVNLSDSNSNAGNNQLRPPQSWEIELETSRNFGAWGSATVKLFHHSIQDYVTIVPIFGGGESRGNVPTARNTGASVNATWRLDPIGIKGAKLDVRAQMERSRLNDPVTGLPRAFDRTKASEISIDFRHDVPGTEWAYGAQFRETDFLPYYRVTEQGIDYAIPRFGALFIENKDVFGLTVNVRAGNLFGGETVLTRSVYSGPRNVSPLLFSEDRHRKPGRMIGATISGSF